MIKFFIFPLLLFFLGCQEDKFDIYQQLEITDLDIKNSKNLEFLKDLKMGKISYQNDRLTPDLFGGKLFEDRNLSKVKITRYFIYSRNDTTEHRSSISVDLNPKMIRYIKSYFDENRRITQIKSCKVPIFIIPIKKRVIQKIVCQEDDDFLPKGLLPPRLPDLSIGVDSPNIPELQN